MPPTDFDATFRAPRGADGVAARPSRDPAGIRALPRQSRRGGERLTGRLYNEYALGSRIQYQVRVGEQVFIVEKLRQQAYRGKLDDEVTIGWDAKTSSWWAIDGGRIEANLGTGRARLRCPRSARCAPRRSLPSWRCLSASSRR